MEKLTWSALNNFWKEEWKLRKFRLKYYEENQVEKTFYGYSVTLAEELLSVLVTAYNGGVHAVL